MVWKVNLILFFFVVYYVLFDLGCVYILSHIVIVYNKMRQYFVNSCFV